MAYRIGALCFAPPSAAFALGLERNPRREHRPAVGVVRDEKSGCFTTLSLATDQSLTP
jgi:hypothetical protein